MTLTIHTDGGSRSNPGPAACAFVISQKEETLYEQGFYLGSTTNNQAEYQGVIKALEYLTSHLHILEGFSTIDFVLDSELIVHQLNGKYKIKHPDLIPLAQQVFALIRALPLPVTFRHVLRTYNKRADFLLNQTLDSQ